MIPWVDLGGVAEAKIKLFSEYGHVVYQIKGNDPCSNTVANILPADTILIPGWGQKDKTFCSESNHAAYQVKGNVA